MIKTIIRNIKSYNKYELNIEYTSEKIFKILRQNQKYIFVLEHNTSLYNAFYSNHIIRLSSVKIMPEVVSISKELFIKEFDNLTIKGVTKGK